jgi:hypothetical protein
MFGRGTIAFVVGYSAGGRNKIAYHVDRAGWLVQTVTLDGKTQESRSSGRLSGDAQYRFVIVIEPNRVVIRDAGGNTITECSEPGFDISAGRFGFKGGFFISIARQG